MPLPPKKLTLIGITFLAAIFIYLNKTSDTPQDDKEAILQPEKKNNDFNNPEIITAAADLYSPAHKTNEPPQPAKQPISLAGESAETIFDPDSIDTYAETEIGTALTQETIDTKEERHHWAFEKESYYINLFSEEESLAGFVLNEAKCESFQCKLSFLLENEQQKDDITNKLMERLISQAEDIQVSFGLNTPSHEAILYIKSEKSN